MRRSRPLAALLAAGLVFAAPARADLWGYVDETGKAHFATERVDERYQLFYKGPTNLDAPPASPTPRSPRPRCKAWPRSSSSA